MLTRRRWWWSMVLGSIAILSVSLGLAGIVRGGAPPVLALFGIVTGGLLWRLSLPEPASTADLALLTSAPAVAKALSREHHMMRTFLLGLLTGATLTLIALLIA